MTSRNDVKLPKQKKHNKNYKIQLYKKKKGFKNPYRNQEYREKYFKRKYLNKTLKINTLKVNESDSINIEDYLYSNAIITNPVPNNNQNSVHNAVESLILIDSGSPINIISNDICNMLDAKIQDTESITLSSNILQNHQIKTDKLVNLTL